MPQSKYKIPKKLYKRTYIVFSALVGIAVILFLFKLILGGTVTRTSTPEFTFVPVSESQTGETKLKLILKPNNNDVSFIKVSLNFDNSNLQLNNEVDVSKSSLSNVISVTSREMANESGLIEISLAKDPKADFPFDKTIDVADLTFANTTNDLTLLTIVDEETQVVDSKSNTLPFKANYAQIISGK